ncbi:MAG: hydroxyacid dehydrogenase [Rhizobiaceae bacterium]|nr:hydroxyacid dehydrogenase [Rhizobiaceae bacterium]
MRPVIACNLDEDQIERLRRHNSEPILLPYSKDRSVWEVPKEADLLFTIFNGWHSAPAESPRGWPYNLKWIQVVGAGVDIFPKWFFDAPLVTTGRGITADAIAEYVIAAIFAHEKQLFDALLVRSPRDWTKRTLGFVSGKKLGLIGLGAIGVRTAAKARALGMNVSYVRRSSASQSPDGGLQAYQSLQEMIAEIDHLVLAVPLTRDTRRMLNRAALAQAKPGLHIINVCRGEVIDDDALLEAIERKQVAAATLDVTSPEPLPEGHPFYRHPYIRLTPHLSYTSQDIADRIGDRLADNLDRYLAGERLNDAVDMSRGY